MDTILKADNIRCGYGEAEVLKGISLKLNAGDFVGVIGPNGSGKSTLLKALSGVLPLREGKVSLFGRRMRQLSRRGIAQKIAVIPQDTAIYFSFSALDVVLMGRTPHLSRFRGLRRQDLEIATRAMIQTDTLYLQDRSINELSGGERQRVIIAKALAQEPEILLLDEPTSHLDINHQVEIFDLLHHLNIETGLTILCVSHDLNFSAEYCRRIMLLKDGKVFSSGRPEEIITAHNIREVYGADVVVRANPIGGAPQVAIVSKKNRSEYII